MKQVIHYLHTSDAHQLLTYHPDFLQPSSLVISSYPVEKLLVLIKSLSDTAIKGSTIQSIFVFL